MGRLYNRRGQTAIRRHLRREATPAEVALWNVLRRHQLRGLRFRRQHGVGPYVVDFFCAAARLAVELDGAIHESPQAKAYDAERTEHLARLGIRVVRFSNDAVRHDLDGVLRAIAEAARA